MSEPLLRVEQLVVEYKTPDGPLRAVDGVDFELEAGGTLGLVGESGCGKTTPAACSCGSRDRSDGVMIDGQDIQARWQRPEDVQAPRPDRLQDP